MELVIDSDAQICVDGLCLYQSTESSPFIRIGEKYEEARTFGMTVLRVVLCGLDSSCDMT
jgi:hypothetical protein